MSGGEPSRVALLTPTFWPEVRRGAERFVADLARGLHARGLRPRVVTSHPGRPRRGPLPDLGEPDIEVVRLWRPPGGRLRRRGWDDHLTHLPALAAELRRGGDGLAHAVQAPDAVVAARAGLPTVLSYMGIPARPYLVGRRGRVGALLQACRRAGAVTALSRAAADAFRRDLGVEARVVHPGIDLGAFTPGGERAETPTIFCNAPVEAPHKRVDALLEALPRVRRERPGTRLVLLRPSDPARARALEGLEGVEPVVTRPAELLAAYRSAWCTALASRGEAFGLVLVESLACGTPVVAREDGGIPEIVDRPEVGVLFGGDDPATLARALVAGLDRGADPASAGACRARAEDFSVDRTTDAYVALYRDVLGSGS